MHNVRLMECVLRMTRFTFPVDWLKRNSVIEPIANHLHELLWGSRIGLPQYPFVTFTTIVSERCMRSRDWTNCKEFLRPPSIISQNCCHRAGADNCADHQPGPPPCTDSTIKRNVLLVTPRNLLLRPARICH